MRYLTRISLVLAIALLYVGAGTKETKLTEGIQPGNLAPEINCQGIYLKGNGYVLVQFWAAYDPQSRLENTRMYNVISRSGIANLRMVSISFDENPSVFQGVIKTDHLNEASQWNEVNGTHSALFKNYRLKAGFGNYLLDSNGMIAAKNLSPSEVLEKVAR
ncbi:MAG: thioredoxin family protein [Dysgonamonadaceae bacterium]|jgi:hypothetical protein|nr:thioredoxin family protein [Dysgonamonadaceae bacterium]